MSCFNMISYIYRNIDLSSAVMADGRIRNIHVTIQLLHSDLLQGYSKVMVRVMLVTHWSLTVLSDPN